MDAVAVRVERGDLVIGTPEDQERAGGGVLDGGLHLDQRFRAHLDDPGLAFALTLTIGARSGRLVAEEVTVSKRPDGPAVTAAALRQLPLESYLAKVRSDVLHADPLLISRRDDTPPGPDRVGTTTVSPAGQSDLARFHSAQRHRHSSVDTLPVVARAYRDALADRDPLISSAPTAAVARALHYSRGHAARLVSDARKAGLLGPARRGRAGEALPARPGDVAPR